MKKQSKNKIFIIIIVILIVALLLITTISNNQKSVIQMPTTKEISQILKDEDFIIIDVRTEEEYKTGHIKNAINIPNSEINKIDYPKNQPIAVYCKTGKRSHEVAKELKKMGYTQIYDLGGIQSMDENLITD